MARPFPWAGRSILIGNKMKLGDLPAYDAETGDLNVVIETSKGRGSNIPMME